MPQTSDIMDMLPRYQRVKVEIERFLSVLELGSMIPTESELMLKFGVSRVTTRKALKEMRDEGILESFKGKGTFLVKLPKQTSYNKKNLKLLGVVVSTLESSDIAKICQGIETEASRKGYRLLISHNAGNPELQISKLKEVSEQNVDGILIYPDGFVTEDKRFLAVLSSIQKKKQNLVFLDRYISGYEFPCVMTDNVKGMYMATEHLILQGYRRPALLGFWKSNTVHTDRRKGFLSALKDYKIPLSGILEKETGTKDFDKHAFEIVSAWVKDWEKGRRPFDSLVCMADSIAYGVFMALKEKRIRVPEDVAIVGYDNNDSGLYRAMGLNLTSVQQPLNKIGEVAAATIIRMIEGGKNTKLATHSLLIPQLIVRTSCGEKR